MDNYPDEYAPREKESFSDWWVRVQSAFSNIPENVAEQWLYRHWDASPYSWMSSSDYDIRKVCWKSDRLEKITSRYRRWGDVEACLSNAKHIIGLRHCVANYMLESGKFPEPIIVLDHRPEHQVQGHPQTAELSELPDGYVLIEGHKRFNLALYLENENKLESRQPVWLMTAKGTD